MSWPVIAIEVIRFSIRIRFDYNKVRISQNASGTPLQTSSYLFAILRMLVCRLPQCNTFLSASDVRIVPRGTLIDWRTLEVYSFARVSKRRLYRQY